MRWHGAAAAVCVQIARRGEGGEGGREGGAAAACSLLLLLLLLLLCVSSLQADAFASVYSSSTLFTSLFSYQISQSFHIMCYLSKIVTLKLGSCRYAKQSQQFLQQKAMLRHDLETFSHNNPEFRKMHFALF